MKSLLTLNIGAHGNDIIEGRVRAVTSVRAHGTQRLPQRPRGLTAQPAQGGAVLTWHLPTRYNDVTGYRIYVGSEKNLAIQIRDRGTRQMFVPLAAGTSPQKQNIFVSVVNGFRESTRLHVQVAAQPSSAPTPTIPVPPHDFLAQFSGGLDKTQSGRPSGKKTP